jgi:hypothetical protein
MFLLSSFRWRRKTVFVIFGGYTDNVLPDVKLKENQTKQENVSCRLNLVDVYACVRILVRFRARISCKSDRFPQQLQPSVYRARGFCRFVRLQSTHFRYMAYLHENCCCLPETESNSEEP